MILGCTVPSFKIQARHHRLPLVKVSFVAPLPISPQRLSRSRSRVLRTGRWAGSSRRTVGWAAVFKALLWLNEKAQLGYQFYVLYRAYRTLISACTACSGPYLNDGISPSPRRIWHSVLSRRGVTRLYFGTVSRHQHSKVRADPDRERHEVWCCIVQTVIQDRTPRWKRSFTL